MQSLPLVWWSASWTFPRRLRFGGNAGSQYSADCRESPLDCLGTKSFEGGLATVGLGLAIHFFVAFVVVSIFYLTSRKIRFLTKRPFVSGVSFGIGVYMVMYWIVLPTAFPTFRHRLSNEVLELAIHICLIGLPTAFIVRRYSEVTDQSS